MTPVEEKTVGPPDAAVGLEEEKPTRVRAEEATHEKNGPPDAGASSTGTEDGAGASQATARAGSGEKASPAEGDERDSVKKVEFQEVSATPAKEQAANLDLLLDVVVPVSVELGKTSLTVKDILSTCQGSVIESDCAAGEPVDILVSGKPLARGEVVVVKDRFGVRITELIGSIEGMAKA